MQGMKINASSAVGIATPAEHTIESHETVRALRDKVASSQAIDPESISLVHNGRLLELEQSVQKAGLKDGDAVKAMPKDPTGGANPSPASLPELTRNRIANEAHRVQIAKVPLRAVEPLHWRGILQGQGRWRGQTFEIRLLLPPDYPARPPIAQFLNQPVPPHPNINAPGFVCLNHLNGDWSPTQNLVSVYEDLGWLLKNPNYNHPLNRAAVSRDPLARRIRRIFSPSY